MLEATKCGCYLQRETIFEAIRVCEKERRFGSKEHDLSQVQQSQGSNPRCHLERWEENWESMVGLREITGVEPCREVGRVKNNLSGAFSVARISVEWKGQKGKAGEARRTLLCLSVV